MKIIYLILFFIIKISGQSLWLKGYINYSLFLYIINPLTAFFMLPYLRLYPERKPWGYALILTDIALPIFGFWAQVIFFVSAPLYRYYYKKITKDNLHQFGKEEFDLDVHNKTYKALLKKEDLKTQEIRPYLDLFLDNNLDLKVNACLKLSKMPYEESVPLLKIALQDENYEVRYMANNILDKIEQKLMNEIDHLEQNILKRPHQLENYVLRGYAYTRLANSGILESVLSKVFLTKALHDFNHVLKHGENDIYMYVKIVQILNLFSKYEEMIDVIQQAMKLKLDNENRDKLYFYRAEAYFNLKSPYLAFEDCKKIDQFEIKNQKLKESLDWWK